MKTKQNPPKTELGTRMTFVITDEAFFFVNMILLFRKIYNKYGEYIATKPFRRPMRNIQPLENIFSLSKR